MSTRSVIARGYPKDAFEGRYHHFDGYPSGVGRSLWKLYHGHFDHDIDQMLEVLIDQHPAGWQNIDADWTYPIGYSNNFTSRGPACYCHGDRHDPELAVTEDNAVAAGCDYAYVFTSGPGGLPTIRILVPSANGWRSIAEVALDASEPNWARLDPSSE